MSELHPELAKNTARTALQFLRAFDGEDFGILSQDTPGPHDRRHLALALDHLQELAGMVLNLADRVVPASLPAAEDAWLPMDTAPKDGTMLRLLVRFDDNATEDTIEPCPTIGANTFDHSGVDEWKFAGWSWSHDCFTEGVGTPVDWLPMLHSRPAAEDARDGMSKWNAIRQHDHVSDEQLGRYVRGLIEQEAIDAKEPTTNIPWGGIAMSQDKGGVTPADRYEATKAKLREHWAIPQDKGEGK